MTMVDEIVDYVMAHGFSLAQAEEHIQMLLEHGELEEFYKNMYVE